MRIDAFDHALPEELVANHSETFTISQTTVRAIALAREENRPDVAIGTTVARALESAKDPPDRPRHVRAATSEETRLLIQPGYPFSIVDMLFTNFHLPQSTLLALVCAFGGHERVLAAYRHAVRTKMRFFSFGDAMFLARASSKGAP
jgi:S-adenosylmethionine:tRNA ribosyltransferase-isomerase